MGLSGISRTTEPLRFDVGIGRAGYADVIDAPEAGGPDKALLPGATTVGRATDGIFPPDDGVDGEIMRELAAATPAALRTPGGFSETARQTLRSLRKGATAAAEQAASEIENLLADADLLERCRLALLET